jgi:hypothetical protein
MFNDLFETATLTLHGAGAFAATGLLGLLALRLWRAAECGARVLALLWAALLVLALTAAEHGAKSADVSAAGAHRFLALAELVLIAQMLLGTGVLTWNHFRAGGRGEAELPLVATLAFGAGTLALLTLGALGYVHLAGVGHVH